jgi:excisionase family DNA binding protein
MINNNDKLMSIEELCNFLNVSKTTGYRLIESRKIAFYKIKGCIRISKKDVLKFLEDSKVETIKY